MHKTLHSLHSLHSHTCSRQKNTSKRWKNAESAKNATILTL